jgi:hypothetical protein
MSKKPARNPGVTVSINGDVSGQVAVGKNIKQAQSVRVGTSNLTEKELKTLSELIEALKQQVSTEAPPDKKEPALEKVSELEKAITDEKPDLSTMEYVRNWFVKNIPALAGTVTSLVVNPIVGKLVEAAGETIAQEFKRRFGIQ